VNRVCRSGLLLLGAGLAALAQPPPVPPKPESNPFFNTLTEPGRLYRAGKLEKSETGFREVLRQASAAADRQAEAWCHDALGLILSRRAQYPPARDEFQQALSAYRTIHDEAGEAYEAGQLGYVTLEMGDAGRARDYYRGALEIYRRRGMVREQAEMMSGLIHSQDPEEGELEQQAMALAQQIGDHRLEAELRHGKGDRLFNAGQFDSAQEAYNRAAELYKLAGDKDDLARVLTSEGRLQRAHGHSERSLDLYRQALKLQQETGDREGQVQGINAMAVAYGYLNDYVREIRLYQQALSMAQETGSERIMNFLSENLAGAYIKVGRSREAAEVLERLAVHDQDHPEYRYGSLAAAYFRMGRFEESREARTKAVELARARGNNVELPSLLLAKASVEERLGEREAALADAQECLRKIEQLRAHLVPGDFMKQGFAEMTQGAFDATIQMLADAQRPERAMEVAEEARSRAFLDLLATRDVQGSRGDALTRLRRVQGKLLAKGESSPEPAADGANNELWSQWTTADPELRSLVTAEPLHLEQLQATARRLNSTILSYWVSDDHTYIWVVPPGGAIHFTRVKTTAKWLKQQIASLWPGSGAAAVRGGASLRLRGGNTLQLGAAGPSGWRELYTLLVRPVEKWLPNRAGSLLTIEPHGPLFMLPFAALQDERGQYLIERFTLHSIPAISLLQFTEKKKEAVEGASSDYLLVADPSGTPSTPAGTRLPPLPGARREAAAISRLLTGSRVTLLEGAEASESKVEELARGSTVIHFATHGVIRDDHPLDSFLGLGTSGANPEQDGHLTAQKIYGLELHAKLVFLSACRSGRGAISGDGINGLTRAFLYAGTPSVVASLWDVADNTAYRLVTGFYRAWLGGSDKARALRIAQLGLLRALRAGQVKIHTSTGDVALPEDPVLWASFVLQGEP
jgi:CHAT domain-containing protein/tetratricopeptide (TPR) repeat protein